MPIRCVRALPGASRSSCACPVGKLCKSVSLKPLKKDNFFEESDKTSVTRTTLWGTFYDLIDDTAQISKSHDAFGDALKNQLLEPIQAAVKQQKDDRRVIQDAAEDLVKRLNEAKVLVKKSFVKFEEAFDKHAEYQATCERYNATGRIKDYDKMLTKVRAAKQRLDEASEKHEDAKAGLERLRVGIERTESPRLMARMREQEGSRMKGALANLLELIELERRCASMDERYASEMVSKVKQIDLHADDQFFTRLHVETSGITTGAMVSLAATPKKPVPVAAMARTPPPALKQRQDSPPRYTTTEMAPIAAEPLPFEPPAYSMDDLALESPVRSYASVHQSGGLYSKSGCATMTYSAGNITYA